MKYFNVSMESSVVATETKLTTLVFRTRIMVAEGVGDRSGEQVETAFQALEHSQACFNRQRSIISNCHLSWIQSRGT